jgi:hypothetical protein
MYTLLALFIAMFGLYSFERNNKSEHYKIGNNITTKKVRDDITISKKDGVVNVTHHTLPGHSHSKFDHAQNKNYTVTHEIPQQTHGAHLIPTLPPRFSSEGGYGSLRNNMPHHDHTGVPKDPLSYENVVHETFDDSVTKVEGPSGGVDDKPDTTEYPSTDDLIPVSDMREVIQDTLKEVQDHDGDITKSIIYDRQIYANKGSRLRGSGCPIRGDIPIKPHNTGWFQVSAVPHIDLHQGAMNVLAGVNNETSNQMSLLLNEVSTDNTIGGVIVPSRNVQFDACDMDVSVVR